MTPAARLWIWRVSAWAPPVFALLRGIQWTAAGRLGPNPVEFLEHYTGDWALRLLLATLAMTPLRRLTGLTEPIRVRRTLGPSVLFRFHGRNAVSGGSGPST